jgi:hypothetical protein
MSAKNAADFLEISIILTFFFDVEVIAIPTGLAIYIHSVYLLVFRRKVPLNAKGLFSAGCYT